MLDMYGERPTPLCNKPYDPEYSCGKSTYVYYKYRETLYEAIKEGKLPYKGRKC